MAAGSTLVLADALAGEVMSSPWSPPGHHAIRVVYSNRGFCNINNMAIMVEYLRTATVIAVSPSSILMASR